MGTLSEVDQNYLAQNFLAFFNRDYHRVAQAHVEAGWVPASTRVDEFEAAIRAVCEPIFARLAGDHARLRETHGGELAQAPCGMVPAHFRLQAHDDGELAPGERGKAGKAKYH